MTAVLFWATVYIYVLFYFGCCECFEGGVMACLGPIGVVFSKDRGVKRGGMKQEWQKVRRLLVGATPTSCKLLDDTDDFGEDFVREMLKADALEDAAMLCCKVKPAEMPSTFTQLGVLPTAPSRIASIFNTCSPNKAKSLKTGSGKPDKSAQRKKETHTAHALTALKKDADTELAVEVGKETSKNSSNIAKNSSNVAKNSSSHTSAKTSRRARKNKFVVNICKPDRQKLRLYMRKGHTDDAVFDKLARRWHNYDASKRLAKLQTLLLPPCIFQCCDGDTQSCLCDKAAAARFFAKVCDKTSLQCAMLFLSQQRNHEYTEGLPPPARKNDTPSLKSAK